jgi:hypothetical protein
MGLKGWLHLGAALGGLVLAALIVFLVFGQASEQGQVSGEAPGEGRTLCGSVNAARGRDAATIATAGKNLPPVLDGAGAGVRLTAKDRAWVSRLHASSGLCVNQLVVRTRQLLVRTSYPEDTSDTQLDSFAIDTLARAFEPPLAQTLVQLDVGADGKTRTILVRVEAWRGFQRSRVALGLDRSVEGLQQYGKRTEFDERFIRVQGW